MPSTLATTSHSHRRNYPVGRSSNGAYEKPRYELADIFNRYGAPFLASHKVSTLQHKVIRAIRKCRTKALGGHRKKCDQCGYVDESYNSCRNRHCPKCQGCARLKWVMARMRELLSIPYYHVVFTLPHILNPTFRTSLLFIDNIFDTCPSAA